MVKKVSAGVLMYKFYNDALYILLGHPGGPFYTSKDDGVWTIPKGERENDADDLLQVAKREFMEETNFEVTGEFLNLGSSKTKAGKLIYIWAVEGDLSKDYELKSNLFSIEWPPKSGELKNFPEIDKLNFFELSFAKQKINSSQVVFLERLKSLL